MSSVVELGHALLAGSQLEVWDRGSLAWRAVSGLSRPSSVELELQPGSVLVLRLRVSRAPLPSDSLSGLVSDICGSGYSLRKELPEPH